MSPRKVALPKQGFVVAIDGPAGTGKSSVTRRLADVLGFTHIDTGALYRAVAYLLERQQVDFEKDPEKAVKFARSVHLEFKRQAQKNPANRIYADGKDVTEHIRTPEVSMNASRVSAIPGVRAALLGLQRRLGSLGRSILEGRDIGTVVFPDADVKFFLTASVEERAKRRLAELEAAGKDAPSFEDVKNQIAARDLADSTRTTAPLKKALDAVEVDTSDMTLDDVVLAMVTQIRSRIGMKLRGKKKK
jgi:cytidylate kinase